MEVNKYYIEIVRDITEIEDLYRYIKTAQEEMDILNDERAYIYPEDYTKRDFELLVESMDNKFWELDKIIDRYYDMIDKYIGIIESIITDNKLDDDDLVEYLNTEVSDISVDYNSESDSYFTIYLPNVDREIYIGIRYETEYEA